LDGLFSSFYQIQNPNKLKIVAIEQAIDQLDKIFSPEEENSDSEEEKLAHLTKERLLIYKLTLIS
jgi:hypothetical protein